jgi:hypothetical protein
MAWLRSPKQLVKFVVIFILLCTCLFVLLPNLHTTQVTTLSDSKSDDNVITDLEEIKVKEFNTTWDEGKN